jgi:hypothetical protein
VREIAAPLTMCGVRRINFLEPLSILLFDWARTWGFTTTTTVTDFVVSLHFNSSSTIML